MTKLFENKPQRLFTFGCSFTDYFWGTWPMIIAYDLDIPYWNYGRSGAGNQFIISMIVYADSVHKFNENDLIIVSWTSYCREDRYINDRWVIPGNIFWQDAYPDSFVKEMVDPLGCLIRDLTGIRLATEFIKSRKSQFHFLAINDIIDHGADTKIIENKNKLENIKDIFKEEFLLIRPSFCEVLWNNDIWENKRKGDLERFPYLDDYHPTPEEHFLYLQRTFDHKFKEDTSTQMNIVHTNFKEFVNGPIGKIKSTQSPRDEQRFRVYELEEYDKEVLLSSTTIKPSEFVDIQYNMVSH